MDTMRDRLKLYRGIFATDKQKEVLERASHHVIAFFSHAFLGSEVNRLAVMHLEVS